MDFELEMAQATGLDCLGVFQIARQRPRNQRARSTRILSGGTILSTLETCQLWSEAEPGLTSIETPKRQRYSVQSVKQQHSRVKPDLGWKEKVVVQPRLLAGAS